MNDKRAAELISKSLSGEITAEEQALLAAQQATTPDTQIYAHLSEMIQDTIEAVAKSTAIDESENVFQKGSDPLKKEGQTPIEPRSEDQLSPLAKERMRKSMRAELRRKPESVQLARQVAETETAYYSSSTLEPLEESRQSLSRFTLIRKIGSGGLGTVWLARDERLRRNVALKEMNREAAESPKSWKRFQREAEITGHLEHPNVVPLYLSGVNPETGLPFYAMRFLGKQSLRDAIEAYHARRAMEANAPLELHRLLNAFLGVCQAIAFAHSRGVIHRDLKPENVALDNFGQVVVLDWGLAKLDSDGELATRLALSGEEETSLAHTLDGDIVGTPLYMSPEQATGEMEGLDQRTDVYGLGAILFAILSGKAPHEKSASSSGSGRVKELLESIANSATPRPRDINPDVPRDLEAICLRAMSKQPFIRHASANELAQDVENWIAGRHHRQTRYDAMRLAGRDLRSRLCVQLRALMVTAQFMVELPPIQGLLTHADATNEEFGTWRERLSTILVALAKTKKTLTALSFCQFSDDAIRELVRIERSRHDAANLRTLPQSRLRRGPANTFHKTVMEQFPGECSVDIDFLTSGSVRIVAGVPVFDDRNEEPFGMVLAEAELGSLVTSEISATGTQDKIYLVDDRQRVLFSNRSSSSASLATAASVIARWPEIALVITENDEYIESDREFYATRLEFPQRNNSICIVFQVAD